jgi:hypothetical protein
MAHHRPFLGTQLAPRQGLPAGLLAGLGMLGVWAGLAQGVGPGAAELLGTIAATLPGLADRGDVGPLFAGGLIHLLVAVILGLLFAASLDRLSRRDTLIVSTFYGFTIWVVAAFIVGHWFNDRMVMLLRTWWSLLACLSFGLFLGLYAVARGQPLPQLSPD